MKYMQLNLNNCRAAQDLLSQTTRELNIDVAILSEPHSNGNSGTWTADTSGKAAIWSCGRSPLQICQHTQANGFVRAEVNGTHIVSCYLAPSLTTEEFADTLHRIAEDVRGIEPVIKAGDFNAWAVDWGCPRTNQRGCILLETFASLEVVLLNTGTQHTFVGANGRSIIDLTFASSALAGQVSWQVSDAHTHSDHQTIIYTLIISRENQPPNSRRATYKVETLDEDILRTMMEGLHPTGSPDKMAQCLAIKVKRACDAAMLPRRPNRRHRAPVYWWTTNIEEARNECQRARRRYHRARSTGGSMELHDRYRVLKKLLKKAIRKSKRECFLQLCDDAEETPWGTAYKLVAKKLKVFRRPAPTNPQQLERIVQTLFPMQAASATLDPGGDDDLHQMRRVDAEEVAVAARRIQISKAPGPDGIPNKAMKIAIASQPEAFARVYNTCLREGWFPTRWKVQRLVLIPKGKTATDDPSGYRPICLLDTAGKVFERILYSRLEEAIQLRGGLSNQQFGFRKTRSTADAIALVTGTAQKAIEGKRWRRGAKQYCLVATLDIRNAFNTANWGKIMQALREFNVPGYLGKRSPATSRTECCCMTRRTGRCHTISQAAFPKVQFWDHCSGM